MKKNVYKLMVVIGLAASGVAPVHAVECLDPGLTRVITRAMGRAPLAGECNAKLYGVLPADEEAGAKRVKEMLSAVYGEGEGRMNQATQRLPLRKRMTWDSGTGVASLDPHPGI